MSKVLKDVRRRRKHDEPADNESAPTTTANTNNSKNPSPNHDHQLNSPRSEDSRDFGFTSSATPTTPSDTKSPLVSPSFSPVVTAHQLHRTAQQPLDTGGSEDHSTLEVNSNFPPLTMAKNTQQLQQQQQQQQQKNADLFGNQVGNYQQLSSLFQNLAPTGDEATAKPLSRKRSQNSQELPHQTHAQQQQQQQHHQQQQQHHQQQQCIAEGQSFTIQESVELLAASQLQQQQLQAQQQNLAPSLNQVLSSASLEKSLQFFQQSFQEQQRSATVAADTSDLQKTISKQILVHLQVLQKHVLTQLVNVMQDKSQNMTNFSQVLPVLQQLQQLQQSILVQQSSTRENDSSSGVLAMPSGTVADLSAVAQSPSTLPASSTNVNNSGTTAAAMSVDDAGKDEKQNPEQQNNTCIFNMDSISVLNEIKRSLAYNENQSANALGLEFDDEASNENNDCFPNVSSPDLRALLSGASLGGDPDDEIGRKQDEDDLMKKGKKTEEKEELSYTQPFFENQQQLLNLQQVKTFLIFVMSANTISAEFPHRYSNSTNFPN